MINPGKKEKTTYIPHHQMVDTLGLESSKIISHFWLDMHSVSVYG